MKKTVSGSTEAPIGSMHFMPSGELIIENEDRNSISEYDLASLMITQDFIVYALVRDDWMIEFLKIMNTKMKEKQQEVSRPKLFLIKGGLDTPETNN